MPRLTRIPPAHAALFIALMPFAACQCEDRLYEPWDLNEPDATPDIGLDVGLDVAPDVPPDVAPDVPPDVPPDAEPDLPDVDLPEGPQVVLEVTAEQALNERSSLSVGDDGTIWLGFHRCEDDFCSEPFTYLSVASSPRGAGDWTIEDVALQNTTFGLDVYENTPYVAYLDVINGEFRTALRERQDSWDVRTLDVEFTGRFDGLDLTHDDTRLYVTFAGDRSTEIDLFAADMTSAEPRWFKLRTLEVPIGASAALERGLQADGSGNLFLVHRDGRTGPYGVARFKLEDNLWDRVGYLTSSQITASSMVAREGGDVCISSQFGSLLFFSCGPVNDLERIREPFDRQVSGYSSMIEAVDGSLVIAFNNEDNTRLNMARRLNDGTWEIDVLFDGPSYGVSTAIDPLNNDLLVSYYTCRFDTGEQRCTLEFLRRRITR